MAPLIVLFVATAVAAAAGRLGVRSMLDWRAATRVGLAAMFCLTAVAHFNSMRAELVAMVPPVFPNPELMVSLTGVCEVLGAIGLLIRRTRQAASLALIALLMAVLPANVHAALGRLTIGGAPATPLVPRIVWQVFFVALLWWCGSARRQEVGQLRVE